MQTRCFANKILCRPTFLFISRRYLLVILLFQVKKTGQIKGRSHRIGMFLQLRKICTTCNHPGLLLLDQFHLDSPFDMAIN